MNISKWFASLVVLLAAAGCSSTDLSELTPFCEYVGKPVPLQRSERLAKGGRVGAFQKTPYALGQLTSPKYESAIQLPIGHPVTIDSAYEEYLIDGIWITAYGHTTLPGSPVPVRFAYRWGFLHGLNRAPWENDSIPEKRYPKDSSRRLAPNGGSTNLALWGAGECE